jgi:3-dehydroquinate synthase
VTTTIRVELGPRSYDVHIGELTAEETAATIAGAFDPDTTGVAVLVDRGLGTLSPRVAPLVAALARRLPRVERFDLPAGEASKSLAEIGRTAEWLASRGFDRKAAIVGLGGGATTDHAGFAAAIYLRGIAFATVPTTLLAMVDASVGGKTGVDLEAGKNLVGAFHQPRVVIADLGFLDTLPGRERTAGLAEVVKCGFIADPELLALCERAPSAPGLELTRELVARSVRVKADVVASDERESGRRAILNFGHTLGHAFEAESRYALLHGEAVSLGMMSALRIGAAMGVGSPALVARGRAVLDRLGLPTDDAPRIDDAVLARVQVDKKRRGGAIRFVLCPAPGETRFVDLAPADIAAHLGRAKA